MAHWRHSRTRIDRTALGDTLAVMQLRRLRQALPLLSLVLAVNSVALTVTAWRADLGAVQMVPAAAIILTALALLALRVARPHPVDGADARARLKVAAAGMLLLAGMGGAWMAWCFDPRAAIHGLIAAPFMAVMSIIFTTGLINMPRVAPLSLALTTVPLTVRMLWVGDASVRALSLMLVMIAILQLWVVQANAANILRALISQARLRHRADTDILTGLDNRRAFRRKLDALLAQRADAVVTMIDLDRFKDANDSHGHAVGDAILVRIAQRLARTFPEAVSIARLGGDEFALLHRDPPDRRWRSQIDERVGRPIALSFATMPIGASAGQASARDGDTADSLYRRADDALYADKATRRRPRWRNAS